MEKSFLLRIEQEHSTLVYQDESVFRHLQKCLENSRILMKKEISSGPQHSVQGFFILYFFDEQLLTPIAYQMVESLTAATSLWISKEDAIVQTELRLRNEFIWGLAKKPQDTTDENLRSRARLFGYQLD